MAHISHLEYPFWFGVRKFFMRPCLNHFSDSVTKSPYLRLMVFAPGFWPCSNSGTHSRAAQNASDSCRRIGAIYKTHVFDAKITYFVRNPIISQLISLDMNICLLPMSAFSVNPRVFRKSRWSKP